MVRVQEVHLVVLQHGMWGLPADMAFVEAMLRKSTNPRRVLILNSGVNSGRLTYDGIDVLGDRLANLVLRYCVKLQAGGVRKVWGISFVSYSLGGLIARYAIGKLAAKGFFSSPAAQRHAALDMTPTTSAPPAPGSSSRQFMRLLSLQLSSSRETLGPSPSVRGVVPVNFVTFASPHLGSWCPPDSRYRVAYNAVLPYTLSRTGSQLVLADRYVDALPLLVVMADPAYAFHAALGLFQKRLLLANVRHDATVPFTTSSILRLNPYDQDPGQPISKRYPYVVQPTSSGGQSQQHAPARPASLPRISSPGRMQSAARVDVTITPRLLPQQEGPQTHNPVRTLARARSTRSLGPVGSRSWLDCLLSAANQTAMVFLDRRRLSLPFWPSRMQHTPWRPCNGPPLSYPTPLAFRGTMQPHSRNALVPPSPRQLSRPHPPAQRSLAARLLSAGFMPVRLLIGCKPDGKQASTWGASGFVCIPKWLCDLSGPAAFGGGIGGRASMRGPRWQVPVGPSAVRARQQGNLQEWLYTPSAAQPAAHEAVSPPAASQSHNVGHYELASRPASASATAHNGVSVWAMAAAAALVAAVRPRSTGAGKSKIGSTADRIGECRDWSGSGTNNEAKLGANTAVHQPAPSSRLRGDVFAAMLPLLVIMWACMLLWLVVQSAHHYLLLLYVKRDNDWNVRWQSPALQPGTRRASQPQGMAVARAERSASALQGSDDVGITSSAHAHTDGASSTSNSHTSDGSSSAGSSITSPSLASQALPGPATQMSQEPAAACPATPFADTDLPALSISVQPDLLPVLPANSVPAAGSLLSHLMPNLHAAETTSSVQPPGTPAAGGPSLSAASTVTSQAVLSTVECTTPSVEAPVPDTAQPSHSTNNASITAQASVAPATPTSVHLVSMAPGMSQSAPARVFHLTAECRSQSDTGAAASSGAALFRLPVLHNDSPAANTVLRNESTASSTFSSFLPLPSFLRGYQWPVTRFWLRMARAWFGWLCALVVRCGMEVQECVGSAWLNGLTEMWESQLPRLAGVTAADDSTLTAQQQGQATQEQPQQPQPAQQGASVQDCSARQPDAQGGGQPGTFGSQEARGNTDSADSSGKSSMEARQAVQQRKMCDDLNLLHWHRADIDTRHYHAHAAIVVRSAARFGKSHGHVVEYAIRQMREL